MLKRLLTPLIVTLSAPTMTPVGAVPANTATLAQVRPSVRTVLYYDSGRPAGEGTF
ncbi:hypothetical protein [Nocardiopsis sp. CC223A]|uniref:hypothetical protein n=1 Tax=Nocardiopsis sp. CC223A TaxID=3044051 RepID=UPI00278C3D25|nr:hypothetical protein [Nocardiopsis sp. CC223A]